jgi:hydrogenase expression/formation protein HypC
LAVLWRLAAPLGGDPASPLPERSDAGGAWPMCLAIPGQIVELVDHANLIAIADVSGVRRRINVGLLTESGEGISPGDWVLIHVGFAMAKVDEAEARATREFLERLGDPYRDELAELHASAIA